MGNSVRIWKKQPNISVIPDELEGIVSGFLKVNNYVSVEHLDKDSLLDPTFLSSSLEV